MIKIFRKIRYDLMEQNKTGKYFKYAIGEIVLVVIGILIALQINNWNENRKTRSMEVHYLKNIKRDLQMNIAHLDEYIETREIAIASANSIIEHYEGKPIEDLKDFSFKTVNIYTWRKFSQINNTFQELTNSGNLALISNDSIKSVLLNMETLSKLMKGEEAHFRYDAEILLYEPSFEMMDMNDIVQNYTYKVTNGAMGEDRDLSQEEFNNMIHDKKQKNGFVMAAYEFGAMNRQFLQMKSMCNQLIVLIDNELKN